MYFLYCMSDKVNAHYQFLATISKSHLFSQVCCNLSFADLLQVCSQLTTDLLITHSDIFFATNLINKPISGCICMACDSLLLTRLWQVVNRLVVRRLRGRKHHNCSFCDKRTIFTGSSPFNMTIHIRYGGILEINPDS